MKAQPFRSWLSDKYTPKSVSTRLAYARRVEEAYGDLDEQFRTDKCVSLIHSLEYSLTDSKADVPNPTKITVSGNPYHVLNNCKTGVRSYREFLDTEGEAEVANEAVIEIAGAALKAKNEAKLFQLERHLQESLRGEIEQLESGLIIIDDDVERAVESGSIDILAQDKNGAFVVIELKRGEAGRETVGQITGYMGDLVNEEPGVPVRGIIVAAEFNKSCRSALSVIPSLSLRRYRFDFKFEAVG